MLKTIYAGLLLLLLALAIPVAAIAVDISATSTDGAAKPASPPIRPSATAPQNAAVVIRHQKAHCHAWSFNGSGYAADQTAQLKVGASITVKNNDVMSHKLVELSGPAATITTAAMNKSGATSQITFSKPGTYLLGTKPGEDYTKGIVTTGADNVLRMQIRVS
jgi:plastocyanin